MRLSSTPFARLVSALKRTKATVTVTESTCGGLIQSSILAQPGASAVYYGGTVAYNTRRSKKFLLDDDELHASLIAPFDAGIIESGESERYVRTKIEWTRRTSAAFCERIGTDYAIAEGGAAGPTFRPRDLDRGFAAIAVARRDASTGDVEVVRERVVRSRHAHREKNMRLFADEAAKLALEAIVGEEAFEDEEVDGDGDGDEAPPPAPAPFMDRATLLRSDAAALDRLAPSARYVVLRGGTALFRPGLEQLALMSRDEVDILAAASGARTETSFLGLTDAGDGPAAFGVDLIGGDDGALEKAASAVGGALDGDAAPPPHFSDVRTGAPLLAPDHNELALHSMALAQWQRRAPFCSECGSLTVLVDGGTARKCSGCGAVSWPRQDPSMIVVISNRADTRVLLGRSRRHAPRMHTALAGFVEAGETFERAVAREAYEETGVRVDVDSVSYVGSQPWPFPQSAMIGFMARADDRQELNIDTNELVEAAWFDREQVRRAAEVRGPLMRRDVAERVLRDDPSLELLIPPRGVIARTLIEAWLERQ
mmetsp:Transcript_29608/g.87777  ORF Transcript_29608/g.87777 Transcript_29608/m.87777 type:complete len:541 (-) Transcript_29608:60-1682(-)